MCELAAPSAEQRVGAVRNVPTLQSALLKASAVRSFGSLRTLASTRIAAQWTTSICDVPGAGPIGFMADEVVQAPMPPGVTENNFYPSVAYLEEYRTPTPALWWSDQLQWSSRTGAVITHTNQPIVESFRFPPPMTRARDQRWRTDETVEVSGTVYGFETDFPYNHYHGIVDDLARLMVAIEHADPHTAVTVLHTGANPTALELAALMLPPGWSLRKVPAQCLVRPDGLLLAEAPLNPWSPVTPSWIRAKLRSAVSPLPRSRDRKLYITRAGAAKRRVMNQAELHTMLEGQGFEIFRPELLSITEVAQAFSDASVVVTQNGAGIANLLFGDDLKVVELVTDGSWLAELHALAAGCGFSYEAVIGERVPHPVGLLGHRLHVLPMEYYERRDSDTIVDVAYLNNLLENQGQS